MNELHYQRIDKGLKRSYNHAPVSPKADLGSWVIPQDLDPREVLDRYLTEATTSGIASQYGLSRKALVKWLRATLPEDWKQAQIIRALCRKDEGDEGIERAADALSLARAREMLRSGQWDLERLDSANYGQKQEITHISADLGDRLRRARERVIEGEIVGNCAKTVDSEPTNQHTHVMSNNPALPKK